MYHDLPSTASFWSFLLAVDEDLAETVRNRGCRCGGRLHSADYLRKPRGFAVRLPQLQCFRSSFCCDRDGCRKRATPPSTRFLGRKVYAGVIVILISAMRQGPTPRRVRELSERFGADLTTITRWQTFCANTFPKRPSGRSHAPISSPLARFSAFPTRWSTPSSAIIRRARAGCSSCGSSRRSRLPGASQSRSPDDRRRSAQDALCLRYLVGENGLSESFHPICEEA